MKTFDTNKDNQLSFEEVTAQARIDMPELKNKEKYADFEKKMTRVFKKADANGDGFVDTAELPMLVKSVGRTEEHNEEHDEVMKTFDTNRDNQLSFEEVTAQARIDMPELANKEKYADFEKKMTKVFKKADANGDGFVD